MLDHTIPRIGCVPYLNAKPLIEGMDQELFFAPPSELALKLREGELDCALIPVAEILDHPGYSVVEGPMIGCQGPVKSVLLFHHGGVASLEKVYLDPASRTSNLLVQVLFELQGLKPEFILPNRPMDCPAHSGEGIVKIGNPAITRALARPSEPCIDLGAEWTRLTGLPFIFALWAFSPHFPPSMPILNKLRHSLECGLGNLKGIIENSTEYTREFRREYLTRCIQYRTTPAHIEGLYLFQQQAFKLDLLSNNHKIKLV